MYPFINYFVKHSKGKLLECLAISRRLFSVSSLKKNDLNIAKENYYDFSNDFPNDFKDEFCTHFVIKSNFISDTEELNLLDEIEPAMKRMRYEFDHWDNVNFFLLSVAIILSNFPLVNLIIFLFLIIFFFFVVGYSWI